MSNIAIINEIFFGWVDFNARDVFAEILIFDVLHDIPGELTIMFNR